MNCCFLELVSIFIFVLFFIVTRWCRKKTPMTTDVCSEYVSSPETPQTCCRMTPLPLSTSFYRSEANFYYLSICFTLSSSLRSQREDDPVLLNYMWKPSVNIHTVKKKKLHLPLARNSCLWSCIQCLINDLAICSSVL